MKVEVVKIKYFNKSTIILGHVKLIIWFSDTDFQKNDEGGRIFNFCIYMHIGPIFRFHFIDCYHSELPEVTTSYNQRKTQECSEFLQRKIGVVSLWSIQVKRCKNLNADFFIYFCLVINTSQRPIFWRRSSIWEPNKKFYMALYIKMWRGKQDIVPLIKPIIHCMSRLT